MAKNNGKTRLIVFDLDGVIYQDDVFFEKLYDKYDKWAPKKKIIEICDKYLRTDTRKVAGIVIGEMWKGLTDQYYFEAIDSMMLNPGVEEAIIELRRKGFKTMIISSSVEHAVKKAVKTLDIDFYICNKMEIKRGKITGNLEWNVLYTNKGKLIADFCKEKNIDLKDVVCVGDNENDIPMMKEAGLSIAFNTKSEELKKQCKVVVESNDLREILKYIE